MQKLNYFFYLSVMIAIYTLGCNKKSERSEDLNVNVKNSQELLMKNISQIQNEQTRKGLRIFEHEFDSRLNGLKISGIRPVRGVQTQASTCIDVTHFGLSGSIAVEYRNGDCSTMGTYYGIASFKILLTGGVTLLNSSTLPLKLTYVIGGTPYTINLSSTLVSTNGSTIYTFTSNEFQFDDYCSVSNVDIVLSPEAECPDNNVYTGDVALTIGVSTDRNNTCKTIAPIFIAPNSGGNGTLSFGGWISCGNPSFNPCITMPEQAEIQYKLASTSTWSTYTLNPYQSNGTTITGLTSGSYQVRFRNKKVSSPACTGIWSGIATVTVN